MTARTTSSKQLPLPKKRFYFYPIEQFEWQTLEEAQAELQDSVDQYSSDTELVIFEAKFIGKRNKMEIVPFE